MHFPDVTAFLIAPPPNLRPGGWLAIEDALLTRAPATTSEEESLLSLQRCWNIRIQSREEWGHGLKGQPASWFSRKTI